MAREPSAPGERTPGDTVDESDGIKRNDGLLHRRSYLKLAGVATAAAGVGAMATSADEGDYEVIEASGQYFQVHDTFENKIIDVRNGNTVQIRAMSDGATIRNIGIRGQFAGSGFVFEVDPGASGHVTFENIYCADGADPTAGSFVYGPGAFFYFNGAQADVTVRNVNVQGFGNNGFYFSNSEGAGHIRWENCYGANNGVATFRGADGDEVVDCVALGGDGTDYGANYDPYDRLGDGRCVWAWGGEPMRVENCHFDAGTYPAALLTYSDGGIEMHGGEVAGGTSGNVTLHDVGSNPDISIPDGVPTSPEEAASGGGGSSTVRPSPNPSLAHEIVFEAEEDLEYFWHVDEDGPIEFDGDDAQVWISDSEAHAAGVLEAGETHRWSFDTTLADIEVLGEADVEIDGSYPPTWEMYPRSFADSRDWYDDVPWYDGESDLENVILVDGVGTMGGTRYEFTVSGDVEKSNYMGASIDDADVVDSGTVTGSVAGWRDAFRFSGDLEELTVDGNARVYVNDEQVDPGEYGEELPHVLTIVGNGTPASYEVSVDGTIDRAVGEEADDSTTVVSENAVEGSIERGVHRYRFSGAVSDVTFIDGSAHVYVDDERVDPDDVGEAELLPHAIVIDGTDADGESTYSFAVDGDVIVSSYRDATADDGDVIEGSAVSGSVEDSLDAYWFDGDITDFRLTGDASVDVEYNVRSQ